MWTERIIDIMEYIEPYGWNEPEDPCKPHYDSEGDALNCMACHHKSCKHWKKWNEEEDV